VVEAKDIIPILVIGGLAYLALRGRAEEAPPEKEKPPIPQPGPPGLPILAPPLPPEVEEARRIIEEIQEVVEERRREAEVFTPPVIIEQPPPPYVPPPPYPVEPTLMALEEFQRALREYAREEWERVENALRQYGGYAVIFKTEPSPERLALFENMLLNININTRGACVYGGGYRWYDYLSAYVYDVKASWSPSMVECKRLIRSAIESAFSGYYTEVREY
jgi:hypothetical protein